jgi:hypothetical protein
VFLALCRVWLRCSWWHGVVAVMQSLSEQLRGVLDDVASQSLQLTAVQQRCDALQTELREVQRERKELAATLQTSTQVRSPSMVHRACVCLCVPSHRYRQHPCHRQRPSRAYPHTVESLSHCGRRRRHRLSSRLWIEREPLTVLLPPFVMSSVSAASPRFCIVAVALQ